MFVSCTLAKHSLVESLNSVYCFCFYDKFIQIITKYLEEPGAWFI